MSNCDKTHGSNVVDRIQNVCADLIISHVHPCAEILQVDNQCSIIHDLFYALIWFIYMILCTHISDTLHANKLDNVQINTHDDFFAKISHPSCVGYVMFDKCVEINNILENVFRISSMKSLNTTYSCKFTFNLIGHHAVNKFYVCAICITCDKLAGLQINRLSNNSCEPYFSELR